MIHLVPLQPVLKGRYDFDHLHEDSPTTRQFVDKQIVFGELFERIRYLPKNLPAWFLYLSFRFLLIYCRCQRYPLSRSIRLL